MKLRKIALVISALAVSVTSLAGTITTSSNIELLAFDGQKVKKKQLIQTQDNQAHQVVFNVASIIRSGSDDTFFESDPIIVTFNGNNEDIQLIVPELRSDSDVAAFKKSPTVTLRTQSGKTLDYKQDTLKGEGFMPNTNILQNIASYNAENQVASLPALATKSDVMQAMMTPANSKTAKNKITVSGENVAEQQLQYWFQQADKETKKRFLNWAKQH